MKNIIVLAVIAITLFSCTRQAEQQSAPTEKMNGIQFKAKYGFDHPGLDYSNSSEVARGKKPKANGVAFAVFTDLVLSESAGVLTTTISPDAEWGGVQNFFTIDTTNNGVSQCNWNWSNTTAPASMNCAVGAAGNYRSWTSDKVTYDVHLSVFLPL